MPFRSVSYASPAVVTAYRLLDCPQLNHRVIRYLSVIVQGTIVGIDALIADYVPDVGDDAIRGIPGLNDSGTHMHPVRIIRCITGEPLRASFTGVS